VTTTPFETIEARRVMVLTNEVMESRDLTGCAVRMPDLAGRVWFHAIARERIHDDVYRFEVIQLAGRLVDAEIIASVSEMAQASVRTCA
jgi:hypothetical protein